MVVIGNLRWNPFAILVLCAGIFSMLPDDSNLHDALPSFVCACVCAHVWGGMCMGIYGGEKLSQMPPSITHHLVFWDRVSHWILRSSINSAGWPADPRALPVFTFPGLGLHTYIIALSYSISVASRKKPSSQNAKLWSPVIHLWNTPAPKQGSGNVLEEGAGRR